MASLLYLFDKSIFVFLFLFYKQSNATNDTKKLELVDKYGKVVIYDRIVNSIDYDYVNNPGKAICGQTGGSEAFFLILIHSAPENFLRRVAMRETWTRRSMFKSIRRVFVMGFSNRDNVNERVRLESEIYNDIVQLDFIDSYWNLTIKSLSAYKWAATYCFSVKFVLKVDDDIMANLFLLIKHFNSLQTRGLYNRRTIMCFLNPIMAVVRDKRSKYYVSREDYPYYIFTPYCAGGGYIISIDMITDMYNISKYIRFFWVDDFYVTGLLVDAVNGTRQNMRSVYAIYPWQNTYDQFKEKGSYYNIFQHSSDETNKMYLIWRIISSIQFNRHPLLKSYRAKLLYEGDFNYLENFKWADSDYWRKYRKKSEDYDYFDYIEEFKN
jgi:hypothetical protein